MPPPADSSTLRQTHSRVRSASVPLDSAVIASAVAASADAGKTLDFSLKHIGEVSEEAAIELSRIGRDDLDDEGIVTRLALSNNYLRKLPPNFSSLYRLRYLNLRANAFVVFPDVVTKMPSLEILDIGRNKIESLPVDPGTLVNLRVFSLSKNRITRLPSYIANFSYLKMLKVDSNPIEWPPAPIVKDKTPSGDMSEEMTAFITQLKEWYLANAPPERSSFSEKSQGAQVRRTASSQAIDVSHMRSSSSRAAHGRNISEDSVNSEYSATSDYSLVENVNYVASIPALQITKKISPGRSDSVGGSPDTSIPTPDETTGPSGGSGYHGRNASYSAGSRRVAPSGANLAGKQSLPDLRKGYMPNGTIKPALKKTREPLRHGDTSPVPPATASSIAHSEVSPTSAAMNTDETPMDGVRNSYFRRLSTVPLPVSAPPLPPALCQTVDAIRGILFAVSQIYSAIQQYTNAIVERRIANILVRVLDPAKRAMDTLISALERYDATSRRAVPSALECRSVVEACRENVSVCCRVVSVLQLQLKVLAAGAGGDVRFARHLLLMLYGGVAEVVNSWRDLMPHLGEVKEYLVGTNLPVVAPGRTELFSKGLGLNTGPSSSRRPISPIEEHTEPINTIMEQDEEPRTVLEQVRETEKRSYGGSRDLKLTTSGMSNGNKVLSSSPMESPLSVASDIVPSHSSPGPLRSALRKANASHGDISLSSSPKQRTQAQDAGSPIMRSNRLGLAPKRPLLEPVDSLRTVDEDLLTTAEKAAGIASELWVSLEATIGQARDKGGVDLSVLGPVENGLATALEVTAKLRAALRAIREGDGGKKGLYEAATAFAKCVTKTIMLLRTFANSYTISPKLRTTAGRLTQATQETIFFLQGSSFAPPLSARPTSPSFSVGLGLGFNPTSSNLNTDANADSYLRAGSALGRSRSAAVVPVPPASAPRDVPWSAMPGQSFRGAEHPPLIGRTGAQMI
ncbi:leucine-rich repeat-containing protein sog2 [Ceratobasidium sp. AG-Ba]|nr:leucine-rich repeat-containing protein sog2 [Ceratobasidium sp. AG-Ba]QRW14457.1 leucine-rich repeat-containing protein sog2 [Ceratobasidium sp. AG-Ba]